MLEPAVQSAFDHLIITMILALCVEGVLPGIVLIELWL